MRHAPQRRGPMAKNNNKKKAMKVLALIFDTQSELPVRGVMHCMFSVFDSVTLYRLGRA